MILPRLALLGTFTSRRALRPAACVLQGFTACMAAALLRPGLCVSTVYNLLRRQEVATTLDDEAVLQEGGDNKTHYTVGMYDSFLQMMKFGLTGITRLFKASP